MFAQTLRKREMNFAVNNLYLQTMSIGTKLYLDTRRGDEPYPLRLAVTVNRTVAYISTGIKLCAEQWDGNKVIKHPRAQMMNTQLAALKADADCRLLEWQRNGALKGKAAKDVKAMMEAPEKTTDKVTFGMFFQRFANERSGQTKTGYLYTYSRLKLYADIDDMNFEEITQKWLESFERHEQVDELSTATIALHFRYIRAVINGAIDEELTQNYPFRKFKIKKADVKKRSLTLEELRILLNWEVEPHQQRYLDIFRLMLMLRGINLKDLVLLRHEDYSRGRIEYHRAKTGKPYSIKVEPEIKELLQRYKGDKFLLDISDAYKNYKDFLKRMNEELRRIGHVTIGKKGKKTIKPLFPKLTTYWARHTFATIAYNECSIPMDIISDMLGHSNGMRVTNIYIRRNEKIADEAARKVIDKILYDK